MAPVPAAAEAAYCFSACLEGEEAKETSAPWPLVAACDSFCFYVKVWCVKTYRSVSTLDNGEEFIEFNLLTAVFVHHGHDLCDLLAILNQAQSNEGVL